MRRDGARLIRRVSFAADSELGNTVLLVAAAEGADRAVAQLVARCSPAELDAQNKDGATALFRASHRGHAEVVRLLLEHGANANMADGWGDSPLLSAANHGHTTVVRLLAAHRADLCATNSSKQTALILAAEEGHAEMVELLLSLALEALGERGMGDLVNRQSMSGDTALTVVAARGYSRTLALLLPHANPHILKENKTALAWASVDEGNGHIESYQLLLPH